jgi:hypothetical protein
MAAVAQRKAAPQSRPADDPSSLVGCYVWAKPLDDPQYRHELHKGIITGEKKACGMIWVEFKADTLVGKKWLPMNRITGRAQYAVTQKTAS